MSTEREYYIAGGEDLAKALAFIQERRAAFKAMDAVAEKYGGKAVNQGGMIAGLVLDEQPAGWSKKGSIEGKPYFFPKRTSNALRAIARELTTPRLKGAREFHGVFCRDGGHIAPGDGYGIRILYIVWEWLGDTLLLSVPVGSDFKPNGSTPLKMSEYWAIKEDAAARTRSTEQEG